MIITISGTPGAGKGTVGKLLANEMEYKFCSMGDIRREYAQDHRMSLKQLNKLAEIDPASDKLADDFLKEIGQKEDNIVIDARLGFYFIPDSYKIYLDADERTRAHRIMKDNRDLEQYKSLDETVESLKKRVESD